MVGLNKLLTAEEVFSRKNSKIESDCDVLHINKMDSDDDELLSISKATDLELKLPNDAKCVFLLILEKM